MKKKVLVFYGSYGSGHKTIGEAIASYFKENSYKYDVEIIEKEYDEKVNDSMPDKKLRIPYENIVYVGDSATDIPCMRLVKSKGGYSIGVYDPVKDNRAKVYQLFNDGRLSFYAPADYSAKSDISKYMKQIIDEIAAKEAMKTEQKILEQPAGAYKIMKSVEEMAEVYPGKIPLKEKREIDKMTTALSEIIPGNIR